MDGWVGGKSGQELHHCSVRTHAQVFPLMQMLMPTHTNTGTDTYKHTKTHTHTQIHTCTQADLALLPANVVGFGLLRGWRVVLAKVFPGCVCACVYARTRACCALDSHARALGSVLRVCGLGGCGCVCETDRLTDSQRNAEFTK